MVLRVHGHFQCTLGLGTTDTIWKPTEDQYILIQHTKVNGSDIYTLKKLVHQLQPVLVILPMESSTHAYACMHAHTHACIHTYMPILSPPPPHTESHTVTCLTQSRVNKGI